METEVPRPNIGVISDCALQRHVLQNVLNAYGLNVLLSCEPSLLASQLDSRLEQVNCWILELDDEEFESNSLDDLIEQEHTPVLFGLGKAPAKHDERYISWERRLFSKLEEHIGKVEVLESEDSILALDEAQNRQYANEPEVKKQKSKGKVVAKEIWVLAASLGGPAAVKAFLDELPETIKAGFLYAQHVDAHFSNVLTKVLGRHAKLDLGAIEDGAIIYEGDVLVVPVDNEIQFSRTGIEVKNREWEGPYGPSIDQLLKNLVSLYGSRCHAIIFSGMGNDGALAAPTLKRNKCSIWTQSPETCANGSMPQSIIDLDCSELTDSPESLARALVARVGY